MNSGRCKIGYKNRVQWHTGLQGAKHYTNLKAKPGPHRKQETRWLSLPVETKSQEPDHRNKQWNNDRYENAEGVCGGLLDHIEYVFGRAKNSGNFYLGPAPNKAILCQKDFLHQAHKCVYRPGWGEVKDTSSYKKLSNFEFAFDIGLCEIIEHLRKNIFRKITHKLSASTSLSSYGLHLTKIITI